MSRHTRFLSKVETAESAKDESMDAHYQRTFKSKKFEICDCCCTPSGNPFLWSIDGGLLGSEKQGGP
jgi:hypothetical protein